MNIKSTTCILLIATLTACAEYKYQPSFSEFSVTYPSKPESKVMAFTGNDGVNAEAIHTELLTKYTVLKAEFIPIIDSKLLDAQSDAQIREQMLEYAKHNGLKVSHATVERGRGIRIGILRGTKLLGKDKVAMTYLNRTYFGRKSMLIVYTGAPSELYPNDKTDNFLKSVRWNPE